MFVIDNTCDICMILVCSMSMFSTINVKQIGLWIRLLMPFYAYLLVLYQRVFPIWIKIVEDFLEEVY